MYSNRNTVLEEKLFASNESVFQLARRIQGSHTSKGNKGLGVDVRNEVETYAKTTLGHLFLRVFWFFYL